jgi:hypothetical protein
MEERGSSVFAVFKSGKPAYPGRVAMTKYGNPDRIAAYSRHYRSCCTAM